MIPRTSSLFLTALTLFCLAAPAGADLSRQDAYSLLSQANQFFREANAKSNDPDQARRLYERAILNYEKIISDGQIRNSMLFYNLANVLNYRRAERLDKADTNIQKNLAFARSRRIDKVDVRAEDRVFETLFFWHYDFGMRTRLLLACLCFGIVSISLILMLWRGKAAPWVVSASLCGVLTICFLASIILETRNQSQSAYGVIIADEVVARQGDGPNYPESFKEPLHAGTEFDLLERRPGWFRIRLSDGSSSWIPANSADII